MGEALGWGIYRHPKPRRPRGHNTLTPLAVRSQPVRKKEAMNRPSPHTVTPGFIPTRVTAGFSLDRWLAEARRASFAQRCGTDDGEHAAEERGRHPERSGWFRPVRLWVRRSVLLTGWLLLGLLSVGCTQIGAYHGEVDSVASDVRIDQEGKESRNSNPKSSTEEITYDRNSGGSCLYRLAYVEFGDLGSLQAPGQVDRAIKLVEKSHKPLVVTYLHGWKNNASADCNDVKNFKRLLFGLTQNESIKQGHFEVIGVYLGWRGRIYTIPGLDTFSFFDRKAVAERIASNNDCLDTILQITSAARKKGREDNYTILLGHSFGGLVLERVVAHSITAAVNDDSRDLNLPADLIITLNPASDSVLTRQMIASLYKRMKYDEGKKGYVRTVNNVSTDNVVVPGNRQLIVALSAENDRATRYVFPVGTSLGAIANFRWRWTRVAVPGGKEKFPGSDSSRSEARFYTHTPGNTDDLISHEIKEFKEEAKSPGRKLPDPPPQETENALQYNLRTADQGSFWTSEEKGAKASHAQKWVHRQIITENGKLPLTPYWIIRVPSEIIDDHGGIWSENSLALMAAIFRINYPLSRDDPRQQPARGPGVPPAGKPGSPEPLELPPPDPARSPVEKPR